MQKKIASELQELNFSDNRIEIRFETLSDFTENGLDKAEFLISTNKGEPLKPLSKIASGGEMSRIMLAFKNIIADYDSIPTLIFDEIDTGISGITASIVGQKLKQIAKIIRLSVSRISRRLLPAVMITIEFKKKATAIQQKLPLLL